MKKTATLLFLITGFMLTSCKKKYVCYCTLVSTGDKFDMGSFKPVVYRPGKNVIDKRDLQKACDDYNAHGGYSGCTVVKE